MMDKPVVCDDCGDEFLPYLTTKPEDLVEVQKLKNGFTDLCADCLLVAAEIKIKRLREKRVGDLWECPGCDYAVRCDPLAYDDWGGNKVLGPTCPECCDEYMVPAVESTQTAKEKR